MSSHGEPLQTFAILAFRLWCQTPPIVMHTQRQKRSNIHPNHRPSAVHGLVAAASKDCRRWVGFGRVVVFVARLLAVIAKGGYTSKVPWKLRPTNSDDMCGFTSCIRRLRVLWCSRGYWADRRRKIWNTLQGLRDRLECVRRPLGLTAPRKRRRSLFVVIRNAFQLDLVKVASYCFPFSLRKQTATSITRFSLVICDSTPHLRQHLHNLLVGACARPLLAHISVVRNRPVLRGDSGPRPHRGNFAVR